MLILHSLHKPLNNASLHFKHFSGHWGNIGKSVEFLYSDISWKAKLPPGQYTSETTKYWLFSLEYTKE